MLQKTAGDVLGQQTLVNYINEIYSALNNHILNAPGLAITAATSTTFKNVNTVSYLSKGVVKSKVTANYAFTAIAHDIPANATSVQERVYLLTLDGLGAPTVTAGVISAGAGTALSPEYPATGATPIGSLRIAVAAGAVPFTAGTTALDNAALTVTYSDGYPAPSFTAAQ